MAFGGKFLFLVLVCFSFGFADSMLDIESAKSKAKENLLKEELSSDSMGFIYSKRSWYKTNKKSTEISSAKPTLRAFNLPNQNLKNYLPKENFTLKKEVAKAHKENYLAKFFAPWDNPASISQSAARWAIDKALKNPGFGENLLPNSLKFIKDLEQESNFLALNEISRKAIIINETAIRAVPSDKPRFLDPRANGEGYPFDYWQNSNIYANTPILVLHFSKSGEWAFAQTPLGAGFIKVRDLAFISELQISALKKAALFVPKNDNVILSHKNGSFAARVRIGSLAFARELDKFSLTSKSKKNSKNTTKNERKISNKSANNTAQNAINGADFAEMETITINLNKIDSMPNAVQIGFWGFIKDEFGNAKEVPLFGKNSEFSTFALNFSPSAFAELAQNLIGEKYGWGGSLGNRDCSMLLRDLFSHFGIFLERNSAAQMKQNFNLDSMKNETSANAEDSGDFIDFNGLNYGHKKAQILQNAIPFATLLGVKGHILLFLGEKNGQIFVLHDAWGLATEEVDSAQKGVINGRKLLGGVVVSDLVFRNSGVLENAAYSERIHSLRRIFSLEDFIEK